MHVNRTAESGVCAQRALVSRILYDFSWATNYWHLTLAYVVISRVAYSKGVVLDPSHRY
jgi:hypothetical protein